MKTDRLTRAEIEAAKTATYFKDSPYWGTTRDGLSPEGKIAQLRGAVFIPANPDARGVLHPPGGSQHIARSALRDVQASLGLDRKAYFTAMEAEGPAFLKRFDALEPEA